MKTEACDGCHWYDPTGIKVQCFNITMINRGGWNPIPPCRCVEYMTKETMDAKNKQDPRTSTRVPEDKGPRKNSRSVQDSNNAGLKNQRKGKTAGGRGRGDGSGS